jgi:hypothetical protein
MPSKVKLLEPLVDGADAHIHYVSPPSTPPEKSLAYTNITAPVGNTTSINVVEALIPTRPRLTAKERVHRGWEAYESTLISSANRLISDPIHVR